MRRSVFPVGSEVNPSESDAGMDLNEFSGVVLCGDQAIKR
jgi:hypothetical protein